MEERERERERERESVRAVPKPLKKEKVLFSESDGCTSRVVFGVGGPPYRGDAESSLSFFHIPPSLPLS
jgi:hypothetical protein